METHTHHQHNAPKKWTHYLFGFLHAVPRCVLRIPGRIPVGTSHRKSREKQYMKSMTKDLKSDISMLENNTRLRMERIAMIDSFVSLLNSPDRKDLGNDIYFLARRISPPTNIFPSDGTIQQLKSAGNLRLIHRRNVSNRIMAYDQKMRQSLFEMGDELQIREQSTEYLQLGSLIRPFLMKMVQLDNTIKPTNNQKLFSESAELINELIGAAQYIKRVNQA